MIKNLVKLKISRMEIFQKMINFPNNECNHPVYNVRNVVYAVWYT